jgi:hypothetical protein
MQCILYKIYFGKVFHMNYNLICTPICTKILFLQKVGVTEGHGKILPNADLCRKVKSAQFSPIQPPGHSLIAVTRNPLTVWSYEINH